MPSRPFHHFVVLCGLCVATLAACQRVDVDALPPVPQVRFDTFLEGVQRQLAAAYDDVDKKPGDAEANGHLAMLLQTYKQFAAADSMYARTRAIEPDKFQWTYLHGIVQSALGKPDEAIASFRRALTQNDEHPLTKMRLAELLAERGDLTEADALFDEVVRTAPPMSEVYFSHGRFLLEQARLDQAIAAFKEAIRLGGTMGTAYYQLGLAYRQKGDREQAAANFALAKKHEGYSADSSDRILNKLLPLNLSDTPFVHRAKVLAESGRLDEAARFIAMALERNPDSVAAHASMIGLAATRGDFAAVDEHFAKAIALDPDNAKVYFNLGIARKAEQRLVEADRAFRDSIRRDDTDPNAHVQLAVLRRLSGDNRYARDLLNRAIELDPQHQTGNWLLGEVLLEDGELAAAVDRLERATQSAFPLRAIVFAKLAEARLALGDLDGAQAALDGARLDLEQFPNANAAKFVEEIGRKLAQPQSEPT